MTVVILCQSTADIGSQYCDEANSPPPLPPSSQCPHRRTLAVADDVGGDGWVAAALEEEEEEEEEEEAKAEAEAEEEAGGGGGGES